MTLTYLAIAMVAALVLCLLMLKLSMPFMSKNFKQSVRSDVLEHHSAKEGTATMGGLYIVLILLGLAPFCLNFDYKTNAVLLSVLFFSGIGFIDDLLKLKRGRGQGLNAKHKTILMSLSSIILIYFISLNNPNFSTWSIPFTTQQVDLGFFAYIIAFFAIIGTSNAVNLTDGLDGLVLLPVICSLLSFLVVLIASSHDTSLQILIALTTGCCFALLFYNMNPAKLFLGDMGSLSLGAMLAVLAIVIQKTLLLIPFGMVFVLEALSVIIQVISFKLTGKRIFKMSPIHHHFELIGWHENRVVNFFWVIAIITNLTFTLIEVSV